MIPTKNPNSSGPRGLMRGSWRRGRLAAVVAVAVAASLLYPAASVASTDLTATFSNVPSTHNGQDFTFTLTFTPAPDISYRTLRDGAFTVTGGTILKARRATKGSNAVWEMTVRPAVDDDGNPTSDITITLPATTSCSAAGAICTSGNDKLSNETSATVTRVAAATQSVEVDTLTAAFSDVPESHDGSEFSFTLTFTPAPDISYRTLRDVAIEVDGGHVTRTPRAVRRSNARWNVFVQPDVDDNGNQFDEITITLPATDSCDDEGAICTSGNEPLSNETEATVSLTSDWPQAPGAPQSVTAAPGPDVGDLTLSWEAAEATGSDAVTGYRVRLDCGGQARRTSSHTAESRTTTISRLDKRDCELRVAARSGAAFGPDVQAGGDGATYQPLYPPAAPASVSVTATTITVPAQNPQEDDTEIDGTKVTWTAPAGGSAPTSYQIAYWDIEEGSFQYIEHSSTTDLEADIAIAPARLRTVAVRGRVGDGRGRSGDGFLGDWATGWHPTAAPSKLDAMTQSSSRSLSLAHSDSDETAGIDVGAVITLDPDQDAENITGPMCFSANGVYVDTANDRAWIANSCGAWVHALDIGTDGALTHDLDKSLTTAELYGHVKVNYLTSFNPTSLWFDGEYLYVGDVGMYDLRIFPYRLSDGSYDVSRAIKLDPQNRMWHFFGTPAGLWSDGDTMWVVDSGDFRGVVWAVKLGTSLYPQVPAERRFKPSGLDGCYIPEAPPPEDTGPNHPIADCSSGLALRGAINSRYDLPGGAYSDGRWLWVVVDYYETGKAGKLLAFNLLSGERDSSRDIQLHADITAPSGLWSDDENLWVTDKHGDRLYTFTIPQSD